jgi:pyruvate dehydrogenase E1 component alpha subunit/2-oxoisovalerate dehydrogenase E1 component
MYDAELYRTKEEVERWKKRDPVALFAGKLREHNMLTDAGWNELEQQIAEELTDAVAFAEAGPWEPVEDLTKDVYTPRAEAAPEAR